MFPSAFIYADLHASSKSQHVQRHHGGWPTATEPKQGKVVFLFFFKCICFSQIKERDPTLQKKNDPTSRESKRGQKGKRWNSGRVGTNRRLFPVNVCSCLKVQLPTVHMKCNITRVYVLFFRYTKPLYNSINIAWNVFSLPLDLVLSLTLCTFWTISYLFSNQK